MKRKILGFLLLLLAVSAHAQKQRFFNLTVEDVTIDSLLPHFTYAIPIGENYADSIYQLEIRYPEFLDMNAADVAHYNALSGAPLPTLLQSLAMLAKSVPIVLHQQSARNFMLLIPCCRQANGLKFVYLPMVFTILLPMSCAVQASPI